MKLRLITILLASLTFVSAAFAAPSQILIIRHGEKITDADPNLSPRGRQRAQALANLFLDDPRFNQFGSPIAVFAAAPHSSDGSIRPQQTVQPLANKLNLKLNLNYRRTDTDQIAKFVLKNPEFDQKTVVICWVRQDISALAEAFGATGVPQNWPSSIFDRVWKLSLDSSTGAVTKFEDLPQSLLPGDSETVP